ncbi:MAG TPA: ATP-binding protein [Thermomicrobiales bacterium]|nr:ATP-binding protein [Thermomicrobiales bacterium]
MSLRLRLTLGYAVLFLVALALLEVGLYIILRGALVDEIDKALRDRAMQVERALIVSNNQDLSSERLNEDIFVLSPTTTSQELTAPGIHLRVLSLDGLLIAASSNTAARFPNDPDAFDRAIRGRSVFSTTSVGGTRVRLLYRPLRLGGRVQGVIQLGESMHTTERTLAEMRSLLLIGGVVALVSGLAGGWWLTRQSLRPVQRLTETVAGIAETGEFDRRVPEPAVQGEIGRLALTFNDLLDRLQLLLDRQRALVADTSHELRNPLMVLRGNLELLGHDLPASDRNEATTESIEEVDRMTRLVQDLLFLADADEESALQQEDVALEALVAAIAEDAVLIATRDDGTRDVILEANDPIVVHGDPERLRQLIWNLVENAVRYTPAGGTITLALRRHGPVAELTVTDTGIGIPTEHLPHIFERFYRVDTGRSRALGGTGLGLSIVRQIAEAHGGQVRVRSTVGEGSTFTVALPVSR